MSIKTIFTGHFCFQCKYYQEGTHVSYPWCRLHNYQTSESSYCPDHSNIIREVKDE
jgi:hypothetical protein